MKDPRMDRTRLHVLSSTVRLLQHEGAAAVTFSRVSQESRVARSTLYRHWSSREVLLCEAALPGLLIERPDGDADVRAFLINFLTQIGTALARPQTIAAFAHALDSSPVSSAVGDNFQLIAEAFRQVLQERVGPTRGWDLARLAGPVFFRAIVLREETDEQTVAEWVDELLDGRGLHF